MWLRISDWRDLFAWTHGSNRSYCVLAKVFSLICHRDANVEGDAEAIVVEVIGSDVGASGGTAYR
jgi:hypothetical protein